MSKQYYIYLSIEETEVSKEILQQGPKKETRLTQFRMTPEEAITFLENAKSEIQQNAEVSSEQA